MRRRTSRIASRCSPRPVRETARTGSRAQPRRARRRPHPPRNPETAAATTGAPSPAAIAFLWPGITVLAFVLLVAAWALVSGGLMLAAAFGLRLDHGRWWLALGGVVSIIYGVLLVIAPLIGALVLTWWMGAYAI